MSTLKKPQAILFREALQASLDQRFKKAETLFDELFSSGDPLYVKKARAFSSNKDHLADCDMEFLIAMAEKGHAMAQKNLGYCFFYGLGVPKNYAEAGRLYRLADEQGCSAAQTNLRRCYEFGKKNDAEAFRLYCTVSE